MNRPTTPGSGSQGSRNQGPAKQGSTNQGAANEAHCPTPSQSADSKPHVGAQAEAFKQDGKAQLERGKQEAADAAAEFKRHGEEIVSEGKHQAAQLAEDLKHATSEGVTQVKDQAAQAIERQKSSAASQIASVEHALRDASRTLREDHNEQVAGVTEAAAQKLGQLSHYLEDRPLGDLLADVEDFARRRPEIVLGGLFVAGLASARFLKASSRTRRQPTGGVPSTWRAGTPVSGTTVAPRPPMAGSMSGTGRAAVGSSTAGNAGAGTAGMSTGSSAASPYGSPRVSPPPSGNRMNP